MRPIFHYYEIQVDAYISVKFDLSMISIHKGAFFQFSNSFSAYSQFKSVLIEIFLAT